MTFALCTIVITCSVFHCYIEPWDSKADRLKLICRSKCSLFAKRRKNGQKTDLPGTLTRHSSGGLLETTCLRTSPAIFASLLEVH
ncbi:hypothetical protein EMCRGX_G027148 [Ephydatia muelleri]